MRQTLRMFAPLIINFVAVVGIILAYLIIISLVVYAGGIR